MAETSVADHDLSKFSFIEVAGYTDRWVWGENTDAWERGQLEIRGLC